MVLAVLLIIGIGLLLAVIAGRVLGETAALIVLVVFAIVALLVAAGDRDAGAATCSIAAVLRL